MSRESTAELTGFDENRAEVFTTTLPLSKYYEGRLAILDSDDYRKGRGIRYLRGKLFDSRGRLVEDFENRYGVAGEYVGGRVRFDDGTMQED